jgi:hypothetical protein
MDIRLNNDDLNRMPLELYTELLNWLKTDRSQVKQSLTSQRPVEPRTNPQQLALSLESESQTPEEKAEHSHVRLTQLFDAGITRRGMPVRVKLKRYVAKKLGRDYINNLEISGRGTIVFDGQEFDKPSPLAAQVNGSSANGWEYIQVKKNEQWLCLDEVREIWRKTND